MELVSGDEGSVYIKTEEKDGGKSDMSAMSEENTGETQSNADRDSDADYAPNSKTNKRPARQTKSGQNARADRAGRLSGTGSIRKPTGSVALGEGSRGSRATSGIGGSESRSGNHPEGSTGSGRQLRERPRVKYTK
jgi:hypothetical protein